MVEALAEALKSAKTPQFSGRLTAYIESRKQFEQALAPEDYRYFSFQLWQEGIARYTEYRVAKLAARLYEPTKEFTLMKDFSSFDQDASATLDRILSRLPKLSLDKDQRIAFYTVGAAEALLLDEASPDWQRRYVGEKFYPDKYFVKRPPANTFRMDGIRLMMSAVSNCSSIALRHWPTASMLRSCHT
jgi:hypothetical protein